MIMIYHSNGQRNGRKPAPVGYATAGCRIELRAPTSVASLISQCTLSYSPCSLRGIVRCQMSLYTLVTRIDSRRVPERHLQARNAVCRRHNRRIDRVRVQHGPFAATGIAVAIVTEQCAQRCLGSNCGGGTAKALEASHCNRPSIVVRCRLLGMVVVGLEQVPAPRLVIEA